MIDEIRAGQGKPRGELREFDRRRCARAVGIVGQRARAPIVDDAIGGVVGGDPSMEGGAGQRAGAREGGEDGVVETDRIVDR